MKAKEIIIPGIAAGIAIFVISMALSLAFQSAFHYNILKLAGMRSATDPIMALFFAHPIVLGLALAFLYSKTKKALEGSDTQKAIQLGILGFAVYTIPSAFIVYSSMNYPISFTASSLVSSAIFMPIAGKIIVKLAK